MSRREIVGEGVTSEMSAENPPEWLPEGWTMSVRARRKGIKGQIDRYYTSQASGRICRSKMEVMHYLGIEKNAVHTSRSTSCFGKNKNLAGAEANFATGAHVEVSGDKENYGAAWFPGTIVNVIRNTIFLVEYWTLKEDGGCQLLTEIVDAQHIRPFPPCLLEAKQFGLLSEVDAFNCCGWLAGVVSKVLDDAKYIVKLKYRKEKEMEFHHSDLRIRRDWIHGRWCHASKVFLDKCKEEAGPSCESRVETSQPCKKLKEGEPSDHLQIELVPKTPIVEAERDAPVSNIESPSSDFIAASPCITTGLPLNLSFGELSHGQPPCKFNTKTELLTWGEESSNFMLAGSEQQSKAPNFIHSCPILEWGKCKGIRGPRRKALWKWKKLAICQREFGLSLANTVDARVHAEQETKKRKRRPVKKSIVQLLASAKCTELQHLEKTTDLVFESKQRRKGVDHSPLILDIKGVLPHVNTLVAYHLKPQMESSTRGDASVKCLAPPPLSNVIKSSFNTRVEEMSNFCNGFGNIETEAENQASLKGCSAVTRKDLTSNESPSEGVNVDERVLIISSPRGSSSMNTTLPFVKSSSLWESIELMEVFRVMPQQPHFRQLETYSMDFREGMAIGLMVSFANLVASMRELHAFDSRVALEESLKALNHLEENGFDVRRIRSRLEELLEIRNNQRRIEDKRAALKGQIFERESEKDRLGVLNVVLDKFVMELEQHLAHSLEVRETVVAQRKNNESDIARLHEDVQAVEEAYLFAEQHFDTVVVSPWRQ